MRYAACLLVCALAYPVQFLVVPVLLLTRWDGTTTPFGNRVHGRGNAHYAHATRGYWQELLWLTVRNPTNNIFNHFSHACAEYTLTGTRGIGDKVGGGAYRIAMGKAWEFYWVRPYGRRCVRVRLGWKIEGKAPGEACPLVFAVQPFKPYSGA